MAKNFVIINGNWTEEGNYSGYDTLGQRVHIYARQMESLGFKKGDKVPQLFCVGEVKSYTRTDDQGKEIPGSEFNRLTALSVFKTKDELVGAHIASKSIDAEVRKALKTQAVEAGLTDAEIAEMLQAAIS